VYNPVEVTVPPGAPSSTDQFTAVLFVPVTAALNCALPPATRFTVPGLIVTPTCAAAGKAIASMQTRKSSEERQKRPQAKWQSQTVSLSREARRSVGSQNISGTHFERRPLRLALLYCAPHSLLPSVARQFVFCACDALFRRVTYHL
jgi:hypothetical protein